MKTIRIASGAGYGGDRIEPALHIITQGKADYIVFECLAERTIALAQKEKQDDIARGYNPLLDYRMEKIIPLLGKHPVKIITNMGAANPRAAARRIHEIALKNGMGALKIAAVEGDDVLAILPGYYDQNIMETGHRLGEIKERIISANAYIGGREISRALKEGADIVITGRAADPALFAAPLMFEFQKEYDDYDFLGKCVAAGHLLECGGQVTGGYYADPGYKDVPELWNLGFPIIEFSADGGMMLEKLAGTGGLLSESIVKEQLLYEIQDPAAYLTPDVIADFSKMEVVKAPDGRIKISGADGRAKTGTLKVSVGYADGYIGEAEISYGGHNCVARARLAGEIIEKRLKMLNCRCDELRLDLIGVNSLYRDALPEPDREPNEVRLRAAVRAKTEEAAKVIGYEVEALYTNGPAGGGGARSRIHKVVSVASILIPEPVIKPTIFWMEGKV